VLEGGGVGDRGLCPGSGEGGGGRMAVLCSPERCSIVGCS